MKLTNLKLRRMQNGLTQEYVAQQVNLSRGYIAQLENEHASIDGTLLIKLAQLYNCKTADLI